RRASRRPAASARAPFDRPAFSRGRRERGSLPHPRSKRGAIAWIGRARRHGGIAETSRADSPESSRDEGPWTTARQAPRHGSTDDRRRTPLDLEEPRASRVPRAEKETFPLLLSVQGPDRLDRSTSPSSLLLTRAVRAATRPPPPASSLVTRRVGQAACPARRHSLTRKGPRRDTESRSSSREALERARAQGRGHRAASVAAPGRGPRLEAGAALARALTHAVSVSSRLGRRLAFGLPAGVDRRGSRFGLAGLLGLGLGR